MLMARGYTIQHYSKVTGKMKSGEIELLGDRLYISINSPEDNRQKESGSGTNITLKYDTVDPLSFFCNAERGAVDGYAAAICAAAFIKQKIGADDSELVFYTRNGSVKVFCEDNGSYTLMPQRCKLLYTKTAEALGCDVEYSDVFLCDALIRTVKAKDISCFKRSALYPFITYGEIMPTAIGAVQCGGGVVSALGYTDFSANPPSRLLLYAAAAYGEGSKFGNCLASPDGKVSFSVSDFGVSVSLRASLI